MVNVYLGWFFFFESDNEFSKTVLPIYTNNNIGQLELLHIFTNTKNFQCFLFCHVNAYLMVLILFKFAFSWLLLILVKCICSLAVWVFSLIKVSAQRLLAKFYLILCFLKNKPLVSYIFWIWLRCHIYEL